MEENQVKPFKKLLLIGGSAGSLEVLMTLFQKLKTIHSLAIVIILHRKNGDDNLLEELIAMKTKIPLAEVEDKAALLQGHIYVAPPDYHLLFEDSYTIALDVSEKVNYSRPSIDVCFESACEAYGKDVCALLLSGANSDGAAGLAAIEHAGGAVAVQAPETAEVPFMPQQALALTTPSILKPADMCRWIRSFDEL